MLYSESLAADSLWAWAGWALALLGWAELLVSGDPGGGWAEDGSTQRASGHLRLQLGAGDQPGQKEKARELLGCVNVRGDWSGGAQVTLPVSWQGHLAGSPTLGTGPRLSPSHLGEGREEPHGDQEVTSAMVTVRQLQGQVYQCLWGKGKSSCGPVPPAGLCQSECCYRVGPVGY